jgi:phosphoribosylformylglycinamidine synthase I
MNSAVIVFPGSNCDRDAKTVLAATGLNPVMVWHRDTSLPKVDLVIVPGGFSYGDYLRSGAMAAHSPIMREVKAHAERGGLVLGICNGFQVLTEAGLLPGILLRNQKLKFVCREVLLRVENTATPFTTSYTKGQIINVPIAHHDGNYFADHRTLRNLQDNEQIVFRYCDASGETTPESNPNGSLLNIAGICNEKRNVLGMMPHPERHAESLLGGVDGLGMFESILRTA